jgi:hypothetical protein
MKRVVLSFDDGRRDFYTYVYPELLKRGLGATLNVATGYIDGSVPCPFTPCAISEIKEMHEHGIEMASHSDSHTAGITPADVKSSLDKLEQWTGERPIGLALPFNQKPTDELIDSLCNLGIRYFRRGDKNNIGPIRRRITMLFKKKYDTPAFFIKKQKINITKNVSTSKVAVFYSCFVMNRFSVDAYKKAIDLLNDNESLILMFHSVVPPSEIAKNDFVNGAYTIDDFVSLLDYIQSKDNIRIVRNVDLVK